MKFAEPIAFPHLSSGKSAVPCFPFVSFDFPALFDEIKAKHFSGISPPTSVGFFRSSRVRSEFLASITIYECGVDIRIHDILNRDDTPREVIEHILKHELLHLLIRPRQIAGREVKHPPEFWEAERSISPRRDVVWNWLRLALIAHLRIDKKREAAIVRLGWERSPRMPFPTLEFVGELAKPDATALGYI